MLGRNGTGAGAGAWCGAVEVSMLLSDDFLAFKGFWRGSMSVQKRTENVCFTEKPEKTGFLKSEFVKNFNRLSGANLVDQRVVAGIEMFREVSFTRFWGLKRSMEDFCITVF